MDECMSKLADCEKDIRALKRYADEVERTLDSAKLSMSQSTWRGPGGDKLRKEFSQRDKEIRASLHQAKLEMERIRRKLEEEEGAKKKEGGK